MLFYKLFSSYKIMWCKYKTLNSNISVSKQNIKNLIFNFGASHVRIICMPIFRSLALLVYEENEVTAVRTKGVKHSITDRYISKLFPRFTQESVLFETPQMLNLYTKILTFFFIKLVKLFCLVLKSLHPDQITRSYLHHLL